jgi:hypothetical protein
VIFPPPERLLKKSGIGCSGLAGPVFPAMGDLFSDEGKAGRGPAPGLLPTCGNFPGNEGRKVCRPSHARTIHRVLMAWCGQNSLHLKQEQQR